MEIKKRTKIVATLGPASDKCETILAMARAGVNVFRLNFSHGSLEDKKKLVDIIRDINARYQMQLAILADLQGPKLRIGHLETQKVLKTGEELCFSDIPPEGEEHILVSYKDLAKDIKIGNKILLDDGKVSVVVKAIVGDKIVTEVLQGGVLSSNKGFNLPDTHTSLPPLTEKDRTDLSFILSEGLEWVALSFVRSVTDVILLKNLIKQKGALTKVIAKIEKPEAVIYMHDIIDVSDGIMIARGDLGVEIPIETVPLIQKDIISQCICKAKSVIVATQMMESMIESSQPNRSEITDVANAVIDGTDAVMLSGETAVGKYPVLVVATVAKIIKEIERKGYPHDRSEVLKPRSESSTFYSDAIAYNTCKIAGDIGADMILGMTQSGLTGFTLSAYRSRVPLYVSAPTPLLVNQLMLSWGVQSFLCPSLDDVDKNIETPIDILKRKGVLKKGDVVVSTASIPVKDKLPTNMLKIHQVK